MKKSNKVMTAVMIMVVLAAVFLAFSSGFPYADRDLPVGREAEQQRSLNDNLPDAVSSYYDGTTCRLKVVANRSQIDNGERFAEQVVEMYRNNSFHTIRFSTDMGKKTEKLEITVYLQREDIDSGDPVMKIWCSPEDENGEICHSFL